MGRPLRAASRQEALTLAAAGAVFGLVVVAPLVAVVARLDPADVALLASSRSWALFARSVAFAGAVTAGALLLGVPFGAVFARARVPARGVLLALHVFPIFVPPFFSALGWFHLFGVRGALGNERTASFLFGPGGAWAVLVLTFTPIVSALTALGVRSLDPSFEEAGRIVARPSRVLTRILVPGARAQIMLAAVVVFALSLAELGVPMFLRVDVYAAAVFARLGGVESAPGEAFALSLPMIGTAVVLTAVERRAIKGFASLSLRPAAPAPLALGPIGPAVAVLAAVISALPLGALAAHASFGDVPRWLGSSVQNGLGAAFATAAVATPLGIAVGHALARDRRAAQIMDVGFLFAFFVPSAVLGVGIVSAWNRPATDVVYASEAILVLGFLARYGILAVRVFAASSMQTSPSYEEAAAIGGAGYLRRLARIVVPMQARGVLAAFGLTLVFSLRDLETCVLFYPPGSEPLTVRIFTLEANGPTRVVAGLAVLHGAITALVLLVIVAIFERTRR